MTATRTPFDALRTWLNEAWLVKTRAAVHATEGNDDGVLLAAWVASSARRVAAGQVLPLRSTWTTGDRATFDAVMSVVARAAREAASGAPAGMVAGYVEDQAAIELASLRAMPTGEAL